MKDIYITYDRYGRDEWYQVYHLDTNEEKAKKQFKEEALLNFVLYGPDDCHTFQLQRVVMSDYKYRQLRALVNAPDHEKELKEFLMDIYAENGYEVETIYCTDGCSDAIETIKYYCAQNGLDYDNQDDQDAAYKALEDNELYAEMLQQHIAQAY